jgi:hypothetical protein
VLALLGILWFYRLHRQNYILEQNLSLRVCCDSVWFWVCELNIRKSFRLPTTAVSNQPNFLNITKFKAKLISKILLQTICWNSTHEHCPLKHLWWRLSRRFWNINLNWNTSYFGIIELQCIFCCLMTSNVHECNTFMFTLFISRHSNGKHFYSSKQLNYLSIFNIFM